MIPMIPVIDAEAQKLTLLLFFLCLHPVQFLWVEERLVPASPQIGFWAAVEAWGKEEPTSPPTSHTLCRIAWDFFWGTPYPRSRVYRLAFPSFPPSDTDIFVISRTRNDVPCSS
jgi:hypothetical protein